MSRERTSKQKGTGSLSGTSTSAMPKEEVGPLAGGGSLSIMRRMAGLMRPLAATEGKAIGCGSLGHLCSVWCVMAATAALIGLSGLTGNGSWLSRTWIAWAVTSIVAGVLKGVMAYGEQYYNHEMAFSVLRDIRVTVFDKMRTLAPAKLSRRGRGNMVTVLTDDIEALEIFYAHTLSPIAIAVITAVVNLVTLTVLSGWMGLMALVSYLIVGLVIPLLSASPTFRVAMAERTAQGRLHSLLLETLDGRRELVALGAADQVRQNLDEATGDMLESRRRTSRNTLYNDLATQVATLVCMAAFTLAVCALAGRGAIGLAPAMIGLVGFLSSFGPLIPVARLGSGLQPTIAAARRVFGLLDEEPEVEEVAEGSRLPAYSGTHASGLSFGYATGADQDGSGSLVLHDLELDIKPGDLVGVQGENGAGKTTLIDLLMRFRDRNDGDLTVSGLPIETINTADLRARQTLVSQDTYIFSETLADNIAIARPGASREEIAEAASQACLDDLIDQLPKGLDQVLTGNGSELSEGQKQRVALARAFLSQASLLLLDEPTSNMDALLEGKVLKSLIDQQGDRAYLIVSHRPSVLARVDRLLTLQDGRLISA